MVDIARTVLLDNDLDDFVTDAMRVLGTSRSHVVRLALERLRREPVVPLTTEPTAQIDSREVPA